MTENFSVTAICVKSIDYKENDKLLTLCSAERGKLTALARGAKKAAAKLKYAAQPFTFGEYTLTGKGRYIIDCKQIESFSSILNSLDSYYSGCCVLEILMKTCAEDTPSPELVVGAAKALSRLSGGENPHETLKDYMLFTLAESGYKFDFNICAACGALIDKEAYFSASEGVLCPHCRGLCPKKIPSDALFVLKGGSGAGDVMLKGANIFLSELLNELIGIKINSLNFYGELTV